MVESGRWGYWRTWEAARGSVRCRYVDDASPAVSRPCRLAVMRLAVMRLGDGIRQVVCCTLALQERCNGRRCRATAKAGLKKGPVMQIPILIPILKDDAMYHICALLSCKTLGHYFCLQSCNYCKRSRNLLIKNRCFTVHVQRL